MNEAAPNGPWAAKCGGHCRELFLPLTKRGGFRVGVRLGGAPDCGPPPWHLTGGGSTHAGARGRGERGGGDVFAPPRPEHAGPGRRKPRRGSGGRAPDGVSIVFYKRLQLLGCCTGVARGLPRRRSAGFSPLRGAPGRRAGPGKALPGTARKLLTG